MRFLLLVLVACVCALGWFYKEERARTATLEAENSRLQEQLTAMREKGGAQGNGNGSGGRSGAAWRQNRVDNWKTPQEAASAPFERRDGAGSNSSDGSNNDKGPGMNRRRYFDGSGE